MTNTATPSSSLHRKVVPSEVGWQFVPQYYTFVNKQPDRLHCFYTKKSTFIHGNEGEDGKACHGQQEIHQKITSLGFQDCKVFIHSVDAQSSADGGIIIQVIGEMSNRGEEWRKFVQTFFLAEQPNGYFVLNDIFRFLKEETVDSDEARESDGEVNPVSILAEPSTPSVLTTTASELSLEPSPAPAPAATLMPTPAPAPEPLPIEEPVTIAPIVEAPPVPEPEVVAPPAQPTPSRPNGVHTEAEKPPTASSSPAPPAPVIEKSNSPAPPPPTFVAATPPPPAPVAAPTPAPAPAAPKTWANLAARGVNKWGSAVAQDSKGTTEVVAPSAPAPAPPAQQPSTPTAAPANRNGPHTGLIAAQAITTPHCFVKGVTEPILQNALTQHLNTRFGPTKEVDIVRSKACAFVEFVSLEAARKAIIASLPQAQGGEGGVWIDTSEGSLRITIETKKERGDRPVSRPRGGAPPGVGGNGEQVRGGTPTGGDRGSFRGRGRGRGGPSAGK